MNSKSLRNLIYSNLNKNVSLNDSNISLNLNRKLRKKSKRCNLYIYIQASYRSTRITVIDNKGLVLLTLSTGFEFKKSNRKGSFAATRLFRMFMKNFLKLKINYDKIVFCLKGYGPGRRPLIKLFSKGLFRKKSFYLIDLTTVPYNGCRLKKSRRL